MIPLPQSTPAQAPYERLSDVDTLIDRYQLVVPPMPEPDAERRWCVIPWCRNDARPRGVVCKPHKQLQTAAEWTVEDLIARELVKASRAGAGCANPACPAPATIRPSRVPQTDRVRSFAVRRFWGHFLPGGEFLCKVCATLVNEVADAFDPELSPVEIAVEKVGKLARVALPHTTYERLTGQNLLRSKKITPAALLLTDGYTLDQYVLGLQQYVGFWASVTEGRYKLRTEDPEEVSTWLDQLNEAAYDAVEHDILLGQLPDYTIPYTPGAIVLDAMLGRLIEGHDRMNIPTDRNDS